MHLLAVSIFAVVGWGIAFYALYLRSWLIFRLSRILEERPRYIGRQRGLLRKIEYLILQRYDGESINNLLRLVHSELGATAVELNSNPDLNGQANGNASIRLTSGRPVGQNAQSYRLPLGTATIGQLKFDAPRLTRVQELILVRITHAIALQLVAQRTGREVRQLTGFEADNERQRTGFIATLSHELRGPLGMVLNAVELVRDELCGPITEDQKETLGLVQGNVRHLLSLVNDVLDFAKTESGVVIPKRESLALPPILTEVVASARGQAEAKNQKLTFSAPGNLVALVDERHLRQIFLNLITNAIKYTPERGTIVVEAAASGMEIVISVTDSGVGIPEQERQKVFTPFERVSTGINQQGTGLGMPLSKLLAEKNQGNLSFVSELGVGSKFTLTLQAGAAEAATNPHVSLGEIIAPITVSLKGQSVVLASHDADQMHVLSRALGALEANVSQLGSAALVAKDIPQGCDVAVPLTAVIIDSTVLVAHGADPLTQIAHWVKYAADRKVPLVMLTPRAFEFDTAEYLKSGVDVCLAKPFQTSELALTLQRLSAI